MSRRSVGIIVVLLSLQVGERRKWMIIVPYSDYLLTWGNAANNVWRRQNRGAKIQLHQIKETLEHILSTEDLHKNSLLKIEVVRLLKLLRPIITPEEFRRIKLLAQLSLKAQENELNFLIDNPEERWEVIQEVIQLRETVYPLKQGWLTNYLDYVKLQESPIEFHFWVGVCLIGATLKRNVWFNKQDYYSVFPSQFVILVAKSGACKKSTAINIGVDILREIDYVNIMAEKATPEALLEGMISKKKRGDSLTIDCYAMVYASELGFFLGKQSYNEGMIPMLTDLADCPPKREYKTRSKGNVKLIAPGLTFLGGTTKKGMEDSLPIATFGQGFMSRILFIHKDDTPRINSMIRPPVEERVSIELIKEGLRHIEEVYGGFSVSEDGADWYDQFYASNKINRSTDPNMSGYYERKPDHLIKLAMIIAVSEGKDMVLTSDLFERSKFALDQAEQPMPDAFIDREATPSGQNAARLMSLIKNSGGKIIWSKALRSCYRYMNNQEFRRSVDTLVEAKLIEEYKTRSEHVLLMRNLE